jgi:hypothetical protein
MIALGVLVVGMGMAAAALHAGIQRHLITVDDIVRTLIGENAIALARVRLEDGSLPETKPRWLTDAEIGPGDRKYPAQWDTNYGYAIAGWRAQQGRNDYKFLVVTGRHKKRENHLEVIAVGRLTFSNEKEGVSKVVANTGIENFAVGALLIEEEYDGTKFKTIVMSKVTFVGRNYVLLNQRRKAGSREVSVLVVKKPGANSKVDTADAPEAPKRAYRGRAALIASASSSLPTGSGGGGGGGGTTPPTPPTPPRPEPPQH